LSSVEITNLFIDNIPGVSSMMDRTGSVPVCQYIVSTYTSGLPIFQSNHSVQQHTIHALRYVIFKASILPDGPKKQLLRRLSEAFTACQMEQGRVIDSLYGSLSGREKSFREQILNLVDIQKEQVMNQLINHFNPKAWRTGDDNPQGQLPHIQSSYSKSFGEELGLRGYKAAKLDRDKVSISSKDRNKLISSFNTLFHMSDLIKSILADVNQQDENAERLVNRESLMKWAGDGSMNNGFQSHKIFYDETNESDYKDLGKPKEDNIYQPFLSPSVIVSLLYHLFKTDLEN